MPNRPRAVALALVSLVAGALVASACGRPAEEPPHFLYEQDAQSLDNPLPDLRLLENDTFVLRKDWYRPFMMEKALTPRMVQMLDEWAAAARSVGGVGNLAPTLLRTSVPVDPSSFQGAVVRLRKTGDTYEVLERDVVVEHSRDAYAGEGKPFPEDYPEFLLVRPSVPLPELEEGLLVVLRGPKTAEGDALGRGRAFEAERSSRERARAAATALSLPEKDVLLALPLRGTRTRSTMHALAQFVRSQPPPAWNVPAQSLDQNLPVGLWSSTQTQWATMQSWLNKWTWANPSSNVGHVLIGTFKSRDLRDEDGVWIPSLVENPEAAPQKDLGFVLTLPAGPKPAGGYRVVLGAHGLNSRNTLKVGSSNAFCMEVAQVLAKAGLGCLGIDAINHGSRGQTFDFFDMGSLQRTRENFRQSIFDLVQLARLAPTLDVDADGRADLSPQLGLLGNSLGSILGAALLPYAPEVRFAVLNVAGAELGNILTSKDISDKIGLLVVSKTGLLFESPEYFVSFPLFRTLGQLVMEPTDPIHLTERIEGRAVLMQEGVGDITIPNFTTEHLARAMGLQPRTSGASGAEPLRVLYRVDPSRYLPAEKVAAYNGHNVFWDFAPPREQAIRFLEHQGTQLLAE